MTNKNKKSYKGRKSSYFITRTIRAITPLNKWDFINIRKVLWDVQIEVSIRYIMFINIKR